MEQTLLFTYLISFPFGQLLRFKLSLLGSDFSLGLSDIIVGIIFLYSIISTKLRTKKKSEVFKLLLVPLFAAIFSYILSVFIFNSSEVVLGGIYLLRIIGYLFFLEFCINLVREKKLNKELLLNSLLVIVLTSAVFGWIQYFFFPDLTALKELGWDDHLFRLVGTFLDPTFTAIIFVFGIITSIFKFIETKKKNIKLRRLFLAVSLFLTISLAFTFSRAGYLSLIVALLIIALMTKKLKAILFTLFVFSLSIMLLPKPAGEGVNLARTYSISARYENYIETLKIFSTSPVFGVGFNNICLAKKDLLRIANLGEHSCSGSDSSILFILATTGVTGFILLLNALREIYKQVGESINKNILTVSFVALLVHSLFSNSLFYVWIMGYMTILFSLQTFKVRN